MVATECLKCRFLLFLLLISFSTCTGVLPTYTPLLNVERGDLIERYFHLGLGYSEILLFLGSLHGCFLSLRQLKRILKQQGLGRRRNRWNPRDVCQAIEQELRGSASTIGYRQMTQRLLHAHGITTDKETVREMLKILDPEGVQLRSRHRLQRRKYKTAGPNHIWHIDGYDKLKPFGFCIHGAIDGYSRRIMWIEVGSTNNDPFVIAQYYLDCVRQVGGIPKIIRADCGTENVNVAVLQRFFHNQDQSFLYGKSSCNQRIEAWWGMLKRGGMAWWINFFKDLRDCGLYLEDNVIEAECLKFCFMPVIREELHKFAIQWNLHKIRPSRNAESPSERPDLLYHVPDLTGARDLMMPVSHEEVDIAEQLCGVRSPEHGCSEEFVELASLIMQEKGHTMPISPDNALVLFCTLIDDIADI